VGEIDYSYMDEETACMRCDHVIPPEDCPMFNSELDEDDLRCAVAVRP